MNLEIRERLARIVDLLQENKLHPITIIEQVCNLIFLKIIDEEEHIREYNASKTAQRNRWISDLLFVGQSRRYRWSEWGNRSGQELFEFVGFDVFPYMASLVREEPQVANYFRDAQLLIINPSDFKEMVNEIDSISFTKLEVNVKSQIVEYFFTHLAQAEEFELERTPPHIRNLMVEMVSPDLGDTIYDPACGTGGFLIDSVQHILAKYSTRQQEVPIYGQEWLEERGQSIEVVRREIPDLQIYRRGIGDKIPNWETLEHSIFGADISRSMMRIAMINLILHDIRRARIERANSITEMARLRNERVAGKYKVILSNPSIGVPMLAEESIHRHEWSMSRADELGFLGGMMESLAPGGQCAVLVPERLLYDSTHRYINFREKLIKSYDVLAVISLPSPVFGLRHVTITSVLIFQRPVESANITDEIKRNKKVWFYDVRADGFDPKNVATSNRHLTPIENNIPDLLVQWDIYKKSGFRNPTGIEGESLLTGLSSVPQCWWVTVKTIEENDYNLAAKRYKPQFLENVSEDDATELIRETIAIERDIAIGLEQLLSKVENN